MDAIIYHNFNKPIHLICCTRFIKVCPEKNPVDLPLFCIVYTECNVLIYCGIFHIRRHILEKVLHWDMRLLLFPATRLEILLTLKIAIGVIVLLANNIYLVYKQSNHMIEVRYEQMSLTWWKIGQNMIKWDKMRWHNLALPGILKCLLFGIKLQENLAQ